MRAPLAVLGAAALLLALVPTVGSANEHDVAVARGIDRVCPAVDRVGDPASLEDVEGSTHEAVIVCVVEYGIAQGFGDGTFRPHREVTRGQAATFVTNLIETALGEDLVVPDEDVFGDVGVAHADAINALAAAGVVQGRTDGTFGTGLGITRGQLARVIHRAIDLIDGGVLDGSLPPADDTVYFSDAEGSFFQADIQALAGIGVVQGTASRDFLPGQRVTRGQIAAFVVRSADYLDEQQRFLPTAVEVTYEVTLSGTNEVDPDTGELGAGEVGATAHAELVVDAFAGTIDYELDFGAVTGPFAAAPGFHVHVGGLDVNGPIVAFLADGAAVQAADDASGVLSGTFGEDPDEFRFAELVNDPDGFYLNLHSQDFPAGAVRGQLPGGGQSLLEAVTYELTLTGAAEVDAEGNPNQGEVGASASATLTVDPVGRTIEHTLEFDEVTGPFGDAPGYHIHVGTSHVNGPVVLFLATPAQVQQAADHDDSVIVRTITDVDPALLRRLVDEPHNYYVNLHSADYPAGAVRAQLDS